MIGEFSVVDLILLTGGLISVVVGWFRGLIREALSIAGLILAIWASMRFGRDAGSWFDAFLGSEGLQLWVGRALVFVVILIVGGLASWLIAKILRLTGLGGIDRLLGSVFGVLRAVLLTGVLVVGGRYAGAEQSKWWQDSQLLPLAGGVADWIVAMAPRGMELLTPEAESQIVLPFENPVEL